MPAARLGIGVERPDLHAGDALLQQAQRQLAGPVEKGVEILIRSLGLVRHLRQSPVADLLLGAVSHVAVAGAGVVDADRSRLGHPAVGKLAGRPGPSRSQRAMSTAELPRISTPPEDSRRSHRARGRAGRSAGGPCRSGTARRSRGRTPRPPGAEEGLPEPHEPLIGVDPHPDQVRKLLQPERFDRVTFTYCSVIPLTRNSSFAVLDGKGSCPLCELAPFSPLRGEKGCG